MSLAIPVANSTAKRGTDSNRPTVTALICTLNEEKNLYYVLPRIPESVDEVLVIDGHSRDNTVGVVKKLRPDARILSQPGKGKGDALRYGIEKASNDIIVMFDADGSMDPQEIHKYVEPLLNGFDYVKGSRFKEGGGTSDMTRHRIFGNWVFTTLTNIFYRSNYTDLCYGYNAFFKEKFLNNIKIEGNGFEIETEMNIKAWKSKMKVTEVSSFENERIHGEGNLKSFGDGKRILLTIFRFLFK